MIMMANSVTSHFEREYIRIEVCYIEGYYQYTVKSTACNRGAEILFLGSTPFFFSITNLVQ